MLEKLKEIIADQLNVDADSITAESPCLQLRGKGILYRNTPLRPSIRYPEQEPPIGGQRTPVQLPTGKGHDAGDRKHRLLPA